MVAKSNSPTCTMSASSRSSSLAMRAETLLVTRCPLICSLPGGNSASSGCLPVAGRIRRLSGVLHLCHIAPGIGARTVEVGEAIDLRQLAAGHRPAVPARAVRIGGQRGDGAADEARCLRDREMRDALGGVAP